MTYQEIEDMAMKNMKDTSILFKGKKLFRLPKSTTKAELKRLIESGAEFYIEEKNALKKEKRNEKGYTIDKELAW